MHRFFFPRLVLSPQQSRKEPTRNQCSGQSFGAIGFYNKHQMPLEAPVISKSTTSQDSEGRYYLLATIFTSSSSLLPTSHHKTYINTCYSLTSSLCCFDSPLTSLTLLNFRSASPNLFTAIPVQHPLLCQRQHSFFPILDFVPVSCTTKRCYLQPVSRCSWAYLFGFSHNI